MLKISKKTLINLSCSIALPVVLLLIENFILNNCTFSDIYNWCAATSIFICINLVLQIIGLNKERQLFSFGSIYILFSYLINCSYCILMGLDAFSSDNVIYTIFFQRYGTDNFMSALQYSLNCIACVYVGYMFVIVLKKGKSQITNNKINIVGVDKKTKNYGLIMTVVFGSIYFVSSFVQIIISIQSGNYKVLSTFNSSLMGSLALNLQPFYFQGLFLLMIYYKKINRLDKARIYFYIAIASALLSFFSGSRSRGIMVLLVLIVLWIKCIEPLDLKKSFCFLSPG